MIDLHYEAFIASASEELMQRVTVFFSSADPVQEATTAPGLQER